MPENSSKPRSRWHITRATEPTGSDRTFYFSVLTVAFLIILIAAGLVIYNLAFNTVTVVAGPQFDLRSLYLNGPTRIPDRGNPCMVVQEHLEKLRGKDYAGAYEYLSQPLKKEVSLDAFTQNAQKNYLLLSDVSTYSFPECTYDGAGNAATLRGYVWYRSGGRSTVEADFTKEDGVWKISRMAIVYD